MTNLNKEIDANRTLWVFHNTHEVLNNETIMQQWNSMLLARGGVDTFYRSAEWLKHKEDIDNGDQRLVAVLKDECGKISGLVPLLLAEYKLKFSIAGLSLLTLHLRSAYILGSEPMLRGRGEQFPGLMKAINDKIPNCDAIYCDCVEVETEWWNFIHNDLHRSRKWFFEVTDGPYIQHAANIMGSFTEYVSSRSAKTRKKFKDILSKFRKVSNGGVKIKVTEFVNDVPDFLRQASEISSKTWQSRKMGNRFVDNLETRENLCDLAQMGYLRSYILLFGDVPCAFLFGYQARNVYYAAETGYDQAYANYSPGIGLFYHVFEDLHARRSPEIISFGVGDAWYKTRFANIQRECRSVLLLRNTFKNRLIALSYKLFRSSIAIVKRANHYISPLVSAK